MDQGRELVGACGKVLTCEPVSGSPTKAELIRVCLNKNMATAHGVPVAVVVLTSLLAGCDGGAQCIRNTNVFGFSQKIYCTFGCCPDNSRFVSKCCPTPIWVVVLAVVGTLAACMLLICIFLCVFKASRRHRHLMGLMRTSQSSTVVSCRTTSRHCPGTNCPSSHNVTCTIGQGGALDNPQVNGYSNPGDATFPPYSAYDPYPTPATPPTYHTPDDDVDSAPPSYDEVIRSSGVTNKGFQ